MIYFDNSASTKPYTEVVEKMTEVLQTSFANPSSLYDLAIEAEKIIEDSKKTIADDLHCASQNIVLTSSASESINSVFDFVRRKFRSRKKIVCSPTDHAAGLEAAKRLREEGFDLIYTKVNKDGRIDLEALKEQLDSETVLISVILVNNETGVINDIEEIIKIKNMLAPTAFVHIDAVQGWGKIYINLNRMGVDFASFSAHKVHGPKGLGLLYVKDTKGFKPFIVGGGQQNNLRSSTENPVLVAGLAEAVKVTNRISLVEREKKAKVLRSYLLKKLDDSGISYTVHESSTSERFQLANIISISFLTAKAETLLHFLEREHIYLSAGSACHSSSKSQSHVLTEMKIDKSIIDSTVRISFAYNNTIEEIDEFVDVLTRCLRSLRVLK